MVCSGRGCFVSGLLRVALDLAEAWNWYAIDKPLELAAKNNGGNMPRALLGVVLAGFGCVAYAAEPADWGLEGMTAYRAFSCSALAALAEDQKELVRLFNVGLAKGRAYVEAARAGKLTKENNSKAPMAWNMVAGPTADFVLGQIYRMAADDATKDLTPLPPDTSLKSPALFEFENRNCRLIGR